MSFKAILPSWHVTTIVRGCNMEIVKASEVRAKLATYHVPLRAQTLAPLARQAVSTHKAKFVSRLRCVENSLYKSEISFLIRKYVCAYAFLHAIWFRLVRVSIFIYAFYSNIKG
jgi:hypothetical protein